MQKTTTPRRHELDRIVSRLQAANFKVETGSRDDVLYLSGKDYTITVFYCDEFGAWRCMPYDDRIHREVQEAVHG